MRSRRVNLHWCFMESTRRWINQTLGSFHPTKAPYLRLARDLANNYYYEIHKKFNDEDIADKLCNAPDWIKYRTK